MNTLLLVLGLVALPGGCGLADALAWTDHRDEALSSNALPTPPLEAHRTEAVPTYERAPVPEDDASANQEAIERWRGEHFSAEEWAEDLMHIHRPAPGACGAFVHPHA